MISELYDSNSLQLNYAMKKSRKKLFSAQLSPIFSEHVREIVRTDTRVSHPELSKYHISFRSEVEIFSYGLD